MTIKFKPLNDQLVVKETEQTASKNTIIMLQKTHPFQQGVVVAVSDGYYAKPNDENLTQLPVTLGDTILFPMKSGYDFELEGEKYILLRREHILGILTDE